MCCNHDDDVGGGWQVRVCEKDRQHRLREQRRGRSQLLGLLCVCVCVCARARACVRACVRALRGVLATQPHYTWSAGCRGGAGGVPGGGGG